RSRLRDLELAHARAEHLDRVGYSRVLACLRDRLASFLIAGFGVEGGYRFDRVHTLRFELVLDLGRNAELGAGGRSDQLAALSVAGVLGEHAAGLPTDQDLARADG